MVVFMLCIKIFLVRILDVSLGTLRTIITIKGKAIVASIVGFIEVFVWFLIVREALNTEITSIWVAISYSLGFATGTYIGSIISNKFIKGNFGIQVITDDYSIVDVIRQNGYGVSVLDVEGHNKKSEKYMLLIEITNDKLNSIRNLIKSLDPNAFIVVTETKWVQNGYFK